MSTTLRLLNVAKLAVRADVEPGDHVRLIVAGVVLDKQSKQGGKTLAREFAKSGTPLKIVHWSEPNPTCQSCGHAV